MKTTIDQNVGVKKVRSRRKLSGLSRKVPMADFLQEVNRLPLKKRPYRQFNKITGKVEFPELLLKLSPPRLLSCYQGYTRRSKIHDSDTMCHSIQTKSDAKLPIEKKVDENRDLSHNMPIEIQIIGTPRRIQKTRRMESDQVNDILFSNLSGFTSESVMKCIMSSYRKTSSCNNTALFRNCTFSRKRHMYTPSNNQPTFRTAFGEEEEVDSSLHSISIRLDKKFQSLRKVV